MTPGEPATSTKSTVPTSSRSLLGLRLGEPDGRSSCTPACRMMPRTGAPGWHGPQRDMAAGLLGLTEWNRLSRWRSHKWSVSGEPSRSSLSAADVGGDLEATRTAAAPSRPRRRAGKRSPSQAGCPPYCGGLSVPVVGPTGESFGANAALARLAELVAGLRRRASRALMSSRRSPGRLDAWVRAAQSS